MDLISRNCNCREKRKRGGTNARDIYRERKYVVSFGSRAPIEARLPLRFSPRKDEITYIHEMKDGEGLFLRTPKDILPLNAYFKLN